MLFVLVPLLGNTMRSFIKVPPDYNTMLVNGFSPLLTTELFLYVEILILPFFFLWPYKFMFIFFME